MITIITISVPPKINGQISRYLTEIHHGVFVGHVSTRVRDILWDSIEHALATSDGCAYLIYPFPNAQHWNIKTAGQTRKKPINRDGMITIATPNR